MNGRLDFFPLNRGPLLPAVKIVGGWYETSYFGGRIDPLSGRPGNHGGEDLAFSNCFREPMYAVKSGLLSQGWDGSGGGYWSSLFCDDGDYFGYGHADDYAPPFNGRKSGSRWVDAGEVIAYVNSTGGSTGSHLHFAYRPKGSGSYQDPYDLLHDAADYGRFVGGASGGGITPPKPPEPWTPTTPTPPSQEEDDMAELRWQENAGQLWLTSGNTKLYIPAVSKDGVKGEDMKATLIAQGVADKTAQPGAIYLAALKDITVPPVS